MEMAWPAAPAVAPRSAAIGVSRLTGMNSEAISIATHNAIEPTALHVCRAETARCTAAGVAAASTINPSDAEKAASILLSARTAVDSTQFAKVTSSSKIALMIQVLLCVAIALSGDFILDQAMKMEIDRSWKIIA
ncbi:hypothetical protein GMPD_19270 [Geomonas paludis]|uniref:Uncharacterized protein n=1 Tax=Geomonas paludis TaxID=2740185 RepID=A0A6V8MUZ2_9BACT|nr:hypothetical protein GMPD_19270 [Geomonas paludis]